MGEGMTKETNGERLGALVKYHRTTAGRTSREVARAAGVDIATFVRLEKGQYTSPSPITLKGVARALGIPKLELFSAAGYLTPQDLIEMAQYTLDRGDLLPASATGPVNDLLNRTIAEHSNDDMKSPPPK